MVQYWIWKEQLGTAAVGRKQYCIDYGNGRGGAEKTDLRNIQDVKYIHSAELFFGGKGHGANVGSSRRDPIWGDNSEFTDVDLQVPLRHQNRDIGTLVGNIPLESRNFSVICICSDC